jgi:hypothetical protein
MVKRHIKRDPELVRLLKEASEDADARVEDHLYELATTSLHVGAPIFWLKARCGWTNLAWKKRTLG